MWPNKSTVRSLKSIAVFRIKKKTRISLKDKIYLLRAHPCANTYYSRERAKPTQLDDDRFSPTIFVLDPYKMCACRAQGSYVSLQYSHAPFDRSIARIALSKRFHRSGEDTRAKREAPNWEWGIKIPPRVRLQMCVSRTRRKQNRRSAPARCFNGPFVGG